jgi:hypothetical protein
MNAINSNTRIIDLTVGDLIEIMNNNQKTVEVIRETPEKKYVYGNAGIMRLFNCSYASAVRYKQSIIKDAIIPRHRNCLVNVDKALELMKQYEINRIQKKKK